jgi:uncharacterized membrane protein
MTYSLWLLVHLLGVIVWVGGMFFAHMALRPSAAELLQPPQRLPLVAATLGRFFTWVSVSIVLILVSGVAIMMLFLGNGGRLGPHIHAMTAIGLLMMAIFGHIRFASFKRLRTAVAAQDWPAGGAAMNRIRPLVLVNLVLGLITTVIVFVGRGWT